MAGWPRRLAAGGDYRKTPRDRGRWAVRLLAEYGRPHEGTEAEVFVLSQELIYTVAARIDGTYPEVKHTLRRLREMGCRIYPATGAGYDDLKGLLLGAGLGELFDGLMTCEMVNAHKRQAALAEIVAPRHRP